MFSKLFGKKDKPSAPKAPEIMGLFLGGSFKLDKLRLRLFEPELMIEGAAAEQLIQGVGEVVLDTQSKILRFYTDDDGFVQVVLDGGETENCITDVKLWYFYETKSVSAGQWDDLIKNGLSKPTWDLDGTEYQRVWEAVGNDSPVVAMSEKTYEEDGDVTTTDQFAMLYERELPSGEFEQLMVVGEEKYVDGRADRCLVLSTGFNLTQSDLII